MSRKSFWNWLGLPSYADIQALQEASQRQESTLASLINISAEANASLVAIQADLLASVEQLNSTNRSILEAVERRICETIQAGIDCSRNLISGQVTELAHEIFSMVKAELGTSTEQISQSNQAVVLSVEKRICDTVQTWTEKPNQLLASHIQTVTEHAIATAQAELTTALEQAGEKNREAIGAAEQKICLTMHICSEDSQRILSEQADQVAESIAALNALCETAYGLDRDTQKRIEHIITEGRTQNELLRMLLANTLINDVSQEFPEKDAYAGPNQSHAFRL